MYPNLPRPRCKPDKPYTVWLSCRLTVNAMGGVMRNTLDRLLAARGCALVVDRGENTLRVPSSQGYMQGYKKARTSPALT